VHGPAFSAGSRSGLRDLCLSRLHQLRPPLHVSQRLHPRVRVFMSALPIVVGKLVLNGFFLLCAGETIQHR